MRGNNEDSIKHSEEMLEKSLREEKHFRNLALIHPRVNKLCKNPESNNNGDGLHGIPAVDSGNVSASKSASKTVSNTSGPDSVQTEQHGEGASKSGRFSLKIKLGSIQKNLVDFMLISQIKGINSNNLLVHPILTLIMKPWAIYR